MKEKAKRIIRRAIVIILTVVLVAFLFFNRDLVTNVLFILVYLCIVMSIYIGENTIMGKINEDEIQKFKLGEVETEIGCKGEMKAVILDITEIPTEENIKFYAKLENDKIKIVVRNEIGESIYEDETNIENLEKYFEPLV